MKSKANGKLNWEWIWGTKDKLPKPSSITVVFCFAIIAVASVLITAIVTRYPFEGIWSSGDDRLQIKSGQNPTESKVSIRQQEAESALQNQPHTFNVVPESGESMPAFRTVN